MTSGCIRGSGCAFTGTKQYGSQLPDSIKRYRDPQINHRTSPAPPPQGHHHNTQSMKTASRLQGRNSEARRRERVVSIADGREIAYAEYGSSEGVPVVFLHGTPGSRRLGALLELPAKEYGVRVLAPDRPGYGRSTPWPNRSIEETGEFLNPVLDHAGVEAAGLIGFSGGGPYALSTAATMPDRISQVDIVAGATPTSLLEETPTIQRLLAGLASSTPTVLSGLFRGQAWLADRLDPSFVVGQYTETADEVPTHAAEVVKADFVEAFAQSRSGAVTEFQQTASDWGIDFESISADVRLWHGAADSNVPLAGVRRLAQTMPDARLHVLDDADHLQTLLRSIPDVLAGYR